MLELITEVEAEKAEALETLSTSAINASPASFAPAAINAPAAFSTALEGELLAVRKHIQFLKKLLETELKCVFQQRCAPWHSMCSESLSILNMLEVFKVNVIAAQS